MPERGGPTAQAGFTYQNSIAALYLGRMLDLTPRRAQDRVIDVRVEAPTDVDDVVVRMATGGRRFIQAKINLAAQGRAWKALWSAVAKQVSRTDFSIEDIVLIVVGQYDALARDTRDLCERAATATDASEWLGRLTQSQKAIVASISTATLKRDDQSSAYNWLRSVHIEIIPLTVLERDYVPQWMPMSSSTPNGLFVALRSIAADASSIRAAFHAGSLRQRLADDHDIFIEDPSSWGSAEYRRVIAGHAVIEVPGSNLARPIADAFIWPRAGRYDSSREDHFDDDEPSWFYGPQPDEVDLTVFPTMGLSHVVVTGGPGLGKSTLTRALAEKASQRLLLPVVIAIPEFSKTELDIVSFLQERTNTQFGIRVDWEIAADAGHLVLFLDGLDEIALGRRTIVLERLKTFALRHPNVPWLLTVRDASALAAPLGAVIVELKALTSDDITLMTKRYCADVPGLASRIEKTLQAKPELSKLARIPLLLAILLASARRSKEPPTDRSGLLENFIDLLIRPEQFKVSEPHPVDPAILRNAAEQAAFAALEREETSITRRLLQEVIGRIVAPSVTIEPVIERLIACGMLKQAWPSDFTFPFPIVQEYLAAQYLLRTDPAGLPSRLRLAVKRPWAQTIQFAIEAHPTADRIICDLLRDSEDAFSTNLRLAARCVANGAKVSGDTRSAIAKKLALLWSNSGWHTTRRIGELIVDGFSTPLIPEIRAQLANPWLFYSGAAAIVARLKDRDLTLEVLRRMVDFDVSSPYHLAELQPAVDNLADDALLIYVQRVRKVGVDTIELQSLASLIADLDHSRISDSFRAAVALDDSLPVEIRLAAFSLQDSPVDPQVRPLIEFLLDGKEPRRYYFAMRMVAKTPNPEVLLDAAFARNKGSLERQYGYLDSLHMALPEPPQLLSYLKRLLLNPAISGRLRSRVQVFAARYGDDESMNVLLSSLDKLPFEIVSATLLLFGHYRNRQIANIAVRLLQHREFTANERVALISSAVTGLTSIFIMSTFRTGMLDPAPPHPGLDTLRPLLEKYAQFCDYSVSQYLSVDVALATLGSSGALDRLPTRLLNVVKELSDGDNDHEVSHATHLLASRGKVLSLPDLDMLIRRGGVNTANAAIQMLGRHVTRDALDMMFEIYVKVSDTHIKSSTLEQIELLAGRLGVRVIPNGAGLVVVS